jgi:branched-chain amino acid transport system permease protein
VLGLAAAVFGLFIFTPAYRGALSNTLVGVIICLSVVVITGFVGQISLAQMAFAGISAFIVSHLSSEHGWPFPLPIFAGAVVALVIGLLVALPALRVRGVNLAIVTFAFAVAVDDMIFKNNSVNGGFKQALVKAPDWVDPNQPKQRKIFGLIVGDGKLPNPTTAIFCLVVTIVLCYLVANLRRSTTGRQMLAMRANERAAAAAGVNVSATKLLAFAISAFIAGIGGAVIAYRSGNATPDKFDYTQSLVIFAFAYLGGISSVGGAIAGGFLVAGGLVFTFLQQSLGVPPEFTLLLGGLGLVITAIQNPEGIAGRLRTDGLRLKAIFHNPRSPSPAPTTAAPLVDTGSP